jgi:hypothetical protein
MLQCARTVSARPEGVKLRAGGAPRPAEIEFRRRQRAVDERLLAPAGGGQHVVAHLAKQEVDLHARRLDVLRERRRKRAVAAFAVERDLPIARGVDHQRRPFRLDACETSADRARCRRPPHGAHEGIVAAGVEHDQPQLLRALDRDHHLLERYRLE